MNIPWKFVFLNLYWFSFHLIFWYVVIACLFVSLFVSCHIGNWKGGLVPTMLCSVRIQKSLWNFHSKVQLSETYIIKISWYVCWVKILMCSNCFFNKDWWCVFVDSLASFFFIIGHKFIHNWSFNASYCSCDILSFV